MTLYEDIKRQLQAKQVELEQRLSRLKRDAVKPTSRDWSEQAQERENDEVVDALGNETLSELMKVQRALVRIDSEEYLFCSQCGQEIAPARLKVMPYTDLCIQCAEQLSN
ncbi:TraR/DksA family transcriptional regulator [Spartinivicinus ruber]|uniref:TraR/DksA family transcriptional regulator n=1 Tax=Spartinivicinus ruber TaxID=2683272 RepID=UPI0013D2F9D2|nr:TraR/DksA C4-type zinc finger protein [Spartinivicinus ruber]